MITLDQLRVFAQVAESGSFSGAGQVLRRAQSAVSYAIAKLEAELEVELFDRSGHRPVLTAEGTALLGDAQAVAARVDAMMTRARWLSEAEETRVAIAVDVMVPMEALVEQIAALQERYPHVELGLHTESLGGVAKLVLDGDCDLGIGMSFGDIPGGLEHRRALTVPSLGVASPTHPLADLADGFSTDLLRDHVQIVLTDRSEITKGQQRGVFSARLWRVADLHTKRALIRAGFGWGTMPLHLVSEDLEAGDLVPLRPQQLPPKLGLQLHAMWRRGDPPGPIGRWLLDRLAPLAT